MDECHRRADAFLDLGLVTAEISWAKRDVFENRLLEELVLGILEHHADAAPCGQRLRLLGLSFRRKIDAIDEHLP